VSRAAVQRKPARLDARAAPYPGFIEPSHPTLREKAPSGERWVHEIKLDGYRAQAHLQVGRPAIYTRRVYDWTLRFRTIADALATLPADSVILDGEVVVADSRGIPNFALLHADLAAGREDRLLRRTGRRPNAKMATRRPSIRLTYVRCPVAPCTGAWIETLRCARARPPARVAPSVGAWIETHLRLRQSYPQLQRVSRRPGSTPLGPPVLIPE
jgi:hypothetical protein